MRRLLPFTLAFSLSIASLAHAQSEPSATDVDTARTAFQQALELRDKHHDLRGASEKLKAAYALVPTPRIGLELGKTYQQMGQLVEARAAFLDVDHLPQSVVVGGVRRPESAEAKKARDDCRTAASDLDARIPSLVVQVRGGAGQVTIDGDPVNPDALAVPRRMNPGKHIVALMIDGAAVSRKVVDLREGPASTVVVLEPRHDDARHDDTEDGTPPQQHGTSAYVPPNANLATADNPARKAVLATSYILVGAGVASDLIAFVITSNAQKNNCDSVTKVCTSFSGKSTSMGFAVAGDVLVGVGIVTFIVGLALPRTVVPTAPEVGFSPLSGGGYLSAGGHF